MHEVEEDERLAEEAEDSETASLATNTSKAVSSQHKALPLRNNQQTAAAVVTQRKKKVIDSWDDEDIPSSSSEESEDEELERLTQGQSTPATSMGPAWEEESGESLLKVLRAFEKLKREFDGKFKAMWA